jgi:hypothetical protein
VEILKWKRNSNKSLKTFAFGDHAKKLTRLRLTLVENFWRRDVGHVIAPGSVFSKIEFFYTFVMKAARASHSDRHFVARIDRRFEAVKPKITERGTDELHCRFFCVPLPAIRIDDEPTKIGHEVRLATNGTDIDPADEFARLAQKNRPDKNTVFFKANSLCEQLSFKEAFGAPTFWNRRFIPLVYLWTALLLSDDPRAPVAQLELAKFESACSIGLLPECFHD